MRLIFIMWILVSASFAAIGAAAYVAHDYAQVTASAIGFIASTVGLATDRLREQRLTMMRRTLIHRSQTIASQNRTIASLSRMP